MRYLIVILLVLTASKATAQVPCGSAGFGTSGNALCGNRSAVDSVINVSAFGAKGDGVTDDSTAIQNAYNAACNASGPDHNAPSVYLPSPSVCYLTTRPIVEFCNNAQPRLFGPSLGSTGNTTFICPNFNGPGIAVFSQGDLSAGTLSTAHMSLTPSLVTGSGNSLTWASNAVGYFDLYDATGVQTSTPPVGPVNGFTQFTIRGFFNWAGDVNSTHLYPIWSSDGAMDTQLNSCTVGSIIVGACTKAMGYVYVKGADSKLYAALRVGSTTYAINSGSTTVTAGTTYEWELNLDGSNNINLYLGPTPGTVSRVAQQTGTSGTVSQRVDENFFLGSDDPAWGYYSDTTFWAGALDSIEIAKTARHTGASYTADTAKFASDSNTVFLDNFDLNQFPTVTLQGFTSQYPIAQVDQTAFSNTATGNAGWMVLHNKGWGCCGGTYQIDNLGVGGTATTGIMVDAAQVDVEHITGNANVAFLRVSANATFLSRFDEINVAGKLSAIIATGGIEKLTRLQMGSSAYPLVVNNANVDDVYVAPNGNTSCGVSVVQAGAFSNNRFNNIDVDAENGGTFNDFCLQNNSGSEVEIDNSFLASFGLDMVKTIGSSAGNIAITNSTTIPPSNSQIVDDSESNKGVSLGVLRLQGNSYLVVNQPFTVLPSGITATNGGGMAFDIAAQPQIVGGTTAGTFIWSEPINTTNKKVVDVNLLGYENTTGTAQTVTLPNGGLSAVSSVSTVTGTCTGVLISTTTITLPSSMGGTQTGLCEAVGY